MRRRLVLLLIALSATVGLGLGAAAPAGAATSAPSVKVGRDGCGNTQVWINGQPMFEYVMCMPPAPTY
jgi:hypothetical protein